MNKIRRKMLAIFVCMCMVFSTFADVNVVSVKAEEYNYIGKGTQKFKLNIGETYQFRYKTLLQEKVYFVANTELNKYEISMKVNNTNWEEPITATGKGMCSVKSMKYVDDFDIYITVKKTVSYDNSTVVDVDLSVCSNYVPIEVTYGYKKVGFDNIQGLSWDPSTNTLTMENFSGDDTIQFYNHDLEKYWTDDEDPLYGVIELPDVKIKVKGNNNLIHNIYDSDREVIKGGVGMNLAFVGDGNLNIFDGVIDLMLHVYELDNYIGTLTIDGPNIQVKSKSFHAVSSQKFVMNSGSLCIDSYPLDDEDTSVQDAVLYGNIWGEFLCDIKGGTIVFKYEDREGKELAVYSEKIINDNNLDIKYKTPCITGDIINIENATLVFVGDEEAVNNLCTPSRAYSSMTAFSGCEIADSVKIIKGTKADISKLDVKMNVSSDLEYPEIKVPGLVEGTDYDVEYVRNEENKELEVSVTGKGMFYGKVKFVLVNKEGNTVEEKPSEQAKVKEEKEIKTTTNTSANTATTTKQEEKVVETKDFVYNVVGDNEVEVAYVKKASSVLKMKNEIKVGDKKYKVTSIADNAFKNNKKITKVYIGKNIKLIGKNAFAGCKNLKYVNIKSKVLARIGKNAFKGTSKKLKVKVLKAKKKIYAKMIKKAGNKKAKVK